MSTALLLALCATVAAPDDGVVRIDFGTEASPVRKGWLRVTHKTKWSKDAPAGWADPKGLRSRDWPVSREWTYSESRGRKYPPAVYVTDLRQDHVEGTSEAILRVRVPDGDYRVWLLVGTAGGRREQVWNVRLGPDDDAAAAATFPGPHAARVLTKLLHAEGGTLSLRIGTASRWDLCALVAAPRGRWGKVADEIAGIEKEVFLLPADVLAEWKHLPPRQAEPRPAPTPVERKRGFLVYRRPWATPVWPDSAPRREECDPVLRAFAAPGEHEPLTVTVLPLRELADVRVDVSPLVAADGRRIHAEDVGVRRVRYQHVRPNYSTHGVYYRAPDLLMPPGLCPPGATAGQGLRFWIDVRPGPHTPPGIYRGTAQVRVDRKPAAEVPIVFRVLPIKLQQDNSLVYGTYYRHPYDMARRAPDAFSRRWWERKAECEFADMAAHGLNAFVGGIGGRMDKSGRWMMDFDALGAKIDLARRHGFDKPVICHIPTSSIWRKHMTGQTGSHLRLVKELPPKGFFEDMTRLVAAIEAGRKRRGWPELLYYPIDEPGRHEAAVRLMVEVLKAIRRVPGVRTYVTADPAHEAFAPMRPHVDVWCCQPFSVPREQVLADAKKGVAYWCYPNHIAGENDHTPAAGARMTYGFGLWRSGFKALTPWIYQSVVSDPWNYLDGSAMDFFNRTGDDGRPIACVLWEAYREGIDDLRYVTTLRRWIARAREAGLAKEADRAAAELKFVWEAIEVQEKYKHDGLWDAATFDIYRWIIAGQILALQEAVTGRQEN